jgi:glycosyltransferase involved in cell wall biosynthesis
MRDAPPFRLRGLDGSYWSPDQHRGRRLLLTFIQPDCPYSRKLLRVVAALRTDPPVGVPAPVVITFGQEPENRRLAEELGLRCPMLLQDDVEVSSLYGAHETPAGCLIDENGRMIDVTHTGAVGVLIQAGIMPGPEWSWSTTEYQPAGTWYSRVMRNQPAPTPVPLPDRGEQKGRPDAPNRRELPLVSVIMTTRDRPRLLPFALECYRQQTYPGRELIVVDDGSTFPADETAIAAVGGRVIRVPEGTPLGTKLNRGSSDARGVLCQKWDDDDWYAPQFLDVMVDAYLRHNATVCRPTVVYQRRRLWLDLERWRLVDWPYEDVSGGTLLFRRADWQQRPFRPNQRSEDLWFIVDQVQAGAAPVLVDTPDIYVYVRHGRSATDRGNTWQHWADGQNMDVYLRAREPMSRDPATLLPDWALSFYTTLFGERAAGIAAGGERPKLLFQTLIKPGFTGGGLRMRSALVLQALAERYDVYLMVIPMEGEPEGAVSGDVASLCRAWTIVEHHHDAPEETMRRVAAGFRGVRFDAVHTFRLRTALYAEPYLTASSPDAGRPRWQLDLDDIESRSHRRIADLYRANGRTGKADAEDEDARRLASMESQILPRCDRVYVCSAHDRDELRALYDLDNVHVLPNAVMNPLELPPKPPGEVFTFLFVGRLDYYPNEDAVLFLCRDVMPRLGQQAGRHCSLLVVGSGSISGAMREAGRIPGVRLIGKAKRMEPWYHLADAVLAPIRAGGGTRIKILEAMSFRRPVVSTSLGVEGLEVTDGEHALIGDTAEGFSSQCLRLVSDPRLVTHLAANAFELYARKYSPEAIGAALSDLSVQSLHA